MPPAPQRILAALQRFEAAEGRLPSGFVRRRARLLRATAWVALLGSLPWVLLFVLKGPARVALLPGAAMACSVLTLGLLRLQLYRMAVLLLLLGCLLVVLGLSLLVDLPRDGIWRSTHLYLLPLFVCSYYFLQYRQPWLRAAVSLLLLGAFVLLQGAELRWVETPPVALQTRRNAIWMVALLTALMLYVSVYAMLRDARLASELELDFARGIAAGELLPYFQAQCDAQGRLTGAEVLMRWQHPQRGLVPPQDFVPMAEHTGLISPAGQRLLEQVCQLMTQWQQGGPMQGLSLAVNISSVQLQSESATAKLIATVPEALRRSGLLKFELTESAYIHDFDALLQRMLAMRAQGLRLALDDFGTGFSSLSLLRRLPLDQLKVDQAFVRDLPGDADALSIARTIVKLGRDLGLDVVAEGVETRAQLDCLREMGCTGFQGWLIAKPLPAEAFVALARTMRATPPSALRP